MNNGYISKEYIIDKCKEHRDFLISAWGSFADLPKEEKYACDAYGTCWADVINADPVDILPVNEVADHIKNRLYETALHTQCRATSDTIVDMAERIDLWVDELEPNPDQNQWMSTDTLPPQAQQVIVLADNRPWLGYYDKGYGAFFINNGGVPLKKPLGEVQGWFPIPKIPEEGNSNE